MKKIIFFFLLVTGSSLLAQTTISDRNGKAVIVNSPATANARGVIKLSGDLGGTADAPTVPALANIPISVEHSYDRFVATDGNNTTGKGTAINPYLTVAKALTGAQFPLSIHIQGQTFSENVSLVSGQSNINLIADNSSRARQTTVLSGNITTATGFTRLGIRGLTINSGTSIPLVFGSGDAGRHSFENVSLQTTNSSIASINSSFTNWLNFFNCDFSATSVLTLPNLTGSAILRLYDCGAVNVSVGSGWTVYTNGDTVLNHVSSPSSTSLIVDLKTVRTVGVITSQAALTALIATSSGADGAYIINFASPTGITGIRQGDIILKVGSAQGIIYKFLDAPASVIQYTSATQQSTWLKSGSGWTQSATTTDVNSAKNRANHTGTQDADTVTTSITFDGGITNPPRDIITTVRDLYQDTTTKLATKASLASPTFTGTVSGITKTMVGLGNVPNVDATNADNITSGTLANTRLPSTFLKGGLYNSYSTVLWNMKSGGTSGVVDNSTTNFFLYAESGAGVYKFGVDTNGQVITPQIKLAGADLKSTLDSKESTINPGNSTQYYRGDKSWQNLNAEIAAYCQPLLISLGNVTGATSQTIPALDSKYNFLRVRVRFGGFATAWMLIDLRSGNSFYTLECPTSGTIDSATQFRRYNIQVAYNTTTRVLSITKVGMQTITAGSAGTITYTDFINDAGYYLTDFEAIL